MLLVKASKKEEEAGGGGSGGSGGVGDGGFGGNDGCIESFEGEGDKVKLVGDKADDHTVDKIIKKNKKKSKKNKVKSHKSGKKTLKHDDAVDGGGGCGGGGGGGGGGSGRGGGGGGDVKNIKDEKAQGFVVNGKGSKTANLGGFEDVSKFGFGSNFAVINSTDRLGRSLIHLASTCR